MSWTLISRTDAALNNTTVPNVQAVDLVRSRLPNDGETPVAYSAAANLVGTPGGGDDITYTVQTSNIAAVNATLPTVGATSANAVTSSVALATSAAALTFGTVRVETTTTVADGGFTPVAIDQVVDLTLAPYTQVSGPVYEQGVAVSFDTYIPTPDLSDTVGYAYVLIGGVEYPVLGPLNYGIDWATVVSLLQGSYPSIEADQGGIVIAQMQGLPLARFDTPASPDYGDPAASALLVATAPIFGEGKLIASWQLVWQDQFGDEPEPEPVPFPGIPGRAQLLRSSGLGSVMNQNAAVVSNILVNLLDASGGAVYDLTIDCNGYDLTDLGAPASGQIKLKE